MVIRGGNNMIPSAFELMKRQADEAIPSRLMSVGQAVMPDNNVTPVPNQQPSFFAPQATENYAPPQQQAVPANMMVNIPEFGQSDYQPISDLRGEQPMTESDYRIPEQTESATQYSPGTEKLLAQIRKHEGKYDTLGDIGDGAGLSAGAYQFTEKSGSANQLARNLGLKSAKDLTPAILGSPRGRKAQDQLVMQRYFKPAQNAANKYGVKDPRAVDFLIDTNINGGMANVISRAKKMGGLTLNNLKAARKARYKSLATKNPKKYRKYLKGWLNRVDSFV